jgi:hypothetical protein
MARIWDCFTFFDELELLEVRLRELRSVAAKFVLVEATRTFTGRPKPLHFADHKSRFKAFADQIVHVIVDDMPDGPTIDAWARERHQRNAILRGLGVCAPADVVMISDADEIPRANVVGKSFAPSVLQMNLYYYRLNVFVASESPCCSTVMLTRAELSSPQQARDLRAAGRWPLIPNAGWHFSYLGGPVRIQRKLNAFAHQEVNRPEINSLENIEHAIVTCTDLLHRPRLRLETVPLDDSWPECIRRERGLYRSLIAACPESK